MRPATLTVLSLSKRTSMTQDDEAMSVFTHSGPKAVVGKLYGSTIFPTTARFSNCSALAAFVLAVLHAKAVQAKSGFSRDTLDAVVDQAL